ncbi:MAG: S-layer homology domain-containing protein [Clostridia bacterium]|nr:S-layer homology domain-containing protein [Clostridia bacterium]
MDNLDIPNITSTSTVYDPDGMVNIEVVYASAGADGTLKVTVLNEIDGLTAGASFRAAVITGNEVEYAENRYAGIITYIPQDVNYIINRAEAALIFAKVLGNAAKINVIPENYFWDLYGSGEVGEAVNKLAEAGIVNGMEDGSFGANGSFLRSQVATVVARMAGLVAPVRIG